VNGTHPDPRESIFDHVNVYGDIVGNRIHDNFWGVYAFGHEGGRWRNNEVDHNAGYGFDPHDDSDNLLIEGNDVHHNGHLGRGPHGIIASKNCDRLVIRNNRSWANAEHGIMLHRHCDDCLIENNESFGNGGSGIALFDVDRTMVRNNLVRSNSNAGIRLSVGCADNVIVNNEVAYSGEEGLLMLPGTDPAEPDPVDPTVTNRNRRHTVASNLVHHCQSEGLQLTDSGDCLVVGNVFGANAPSMSFVNVSQVVFRSNSIPAGLTVELSGSPAVPTAMLFREQPVVKLVLGDAYCAATFEDDAGAIFDFDQAQVATGVDVQVRSSRSPPRRSAVGQRLSPVTSGCA
jgi:parallel beta-helix repeat protein